MTQSAVEPDRPKYLTRITSDKKPVVVGGYSRLLSGPPCEVATMPMWHGVCHNFCWRVVQDGHQVVDGAAVRSAGNLLNHRVLHPDVVRESADGRHSV